MSRTDGLSAPVKRFLIILFYMALAVLGTCVSTLFLVREYAAEHVHIMRGISFALLGAFLTVPVCALGKKSWLGNLVLFFGVSVYVYLTFDRTVGALAYCFNALVEEINDYYGSGLYYIYLTKKMLKMADSRMAVSFIAFLTGYGYMYVLLKGKNTVGLAALALVSYFLPATIEHMPDFAVFAGVMVFVFCVLARPKRRRGALGKTDTAAVQAMFLIAALVGAVMFAVSRIRPGAGYVVSDGLTELNGRIVFSIVDLQEMDIVSGLSFSDIGSFGGGGAAISAGKLGQVAKITYSGEPMFSVTAPKEAGPLYLKAYQGEVYTSRQWKNFDDNVYREAEDVFEIMQEADFYPYTEIAELLNYLTGLGEEVNWYEYGIDVVQYRGDGYSYVPMDTLEADGEDIRERLEYDKAVALYGDEKGKKNSTHSFTALAWRKEFPAAELAKRYDDTLAGKIEMKMEPGKQYVIAYVLAKDLYRQFVYENYLDVNTPCGDKIRQVLLPEINPGEYSLEDGRGRIQFIKDVVEYLGRNYDYTLKPGGVPEDRDFVEYFLFETKQGFCTYFATAAVMIFRSAGIPARYVEGFVIPESLFRGRPTQKIGVEGMINGELQNEVWDYYEFEVTDRYAHAWVEIYLDGIGWLLVDPTPGYSSYPGSGSDGADVETGVLPEQESTTEEESESETESEIQDKSEEQTETETSPEDGRKPDGMTGDGTGASASKNAQSIGKKLLFVLKTAGGMLWRVLKIVGIPAAVILFLVFRQKYVEEKRNKLYNGECKLSRRQRVEKILKYLERLLGRGGNMLPKNESYAEYFIRSMQDTAADGGECQRLSEAAGLIEKLLYSDGAPAEEDIVRLADFVADRRAAVYNRANWAKKIIYKYIFVL